MKKKRRVAVFDIDGTIFRSSLLIEITDALVARGIFPKKVRGQYEKARQRWLDRKSSYENYIRAVINAFDSNIAGIHYKTFKKIAREVTARRKDRVYRYTRDLVAGLNKKKYYLLAISHSPKGVADEFAKRLGFDKVYGRMLETDKDGVFTGKSMHAELIFDKAKVLRRAIEKENLTLRGSVGVGDTESDIPLLRMVKHPIAFNPNKKLYNHAKRHGWKIVVERKDVIYELYERS